MNRGYQLEFSGTYKMLYNQNEREYKAKKTLSVLNDDLKHDLHKLRLLDIGCSTGIMTNLLSKSFGSTVGIDIDKGGVEFAQEKFAGKKLKFMIMDSMNIKFPDNSFDVINCTQVYEHVPDSRKLMAEIYILLKPGGICYFAAGNRLVLIEGHYKLPLLSVVPKAIAHFYLSVLGRGNHYYETHLTLWSLRKLVRKFQVIDYTIKVLQEPRKFYATDIVRQGSTKQKIVLTFINVLYWLSPGYIWLLKKPGKGIQG